MGLPSPTHVVDTCTELRFFAVFFWRLFPSCVGLLLYLSHVALLLIQSPCHLFFLREERNIVTAPSLCTFSIIVGVQAADAPPSDLQLQHLQGADPEEESQIDLKKMKLKLKLASGGLKNVFLREVRQGWEASKRRPKVVYSVALR